MMRVFVAVEITDDVIIESVKRFQDGMGIDAVAVKSNNLHFTLQFIGEVSEETVQRICQSLEGIEFSDFKVTLKGVGAYPRPGLAKILWIGADESGGSLLAELSEKVKRSLESLGFSPYRAFRPHITIFRIKKKIRDISSELDCAKRIDFGVQRVSSIKLKKSELGSNGAVYSDLLEVCSKK